MSTPLRGHRTPFVLPPDFAEVADRAWARMKSAPGFLTEREGRFLALAAAVGPASGEILEIGSFKGNSTVGLATVANHYGDGPVVAVDPHTAPSSTDPDLRGKNTSYDDFQNTLRTAELLHAVEVHRMTSVELARTWQRPIRLLWIDGDHTYAGAHSDFMLYRRFLVDGGIVAMHDALNAFDGPIRVMVEEVLASNDFGPVGFCGSIAWAQYRPGDGASPMYARMRRRLARKAARLIPFVQGPRPRGIRSLMYKLARGRVPHEAVDPVRWSRQVGNRQLGNRQEQ
jgi:hypothetical protein